MTRSSERRKGCEGAARWRGEVALADSVLAGRLLVPASWVEWEVRIAGGEREAGCDAASHSLAMRVEACVAVGV